MTPYFPHQPHQPVEHTIVCPDGVTRTFILKWRTCNYGEGDLIDRWVIDWRDEPRSFFATFNTPEEARRYLDEWPERERMIAANPRWPLPPWAPK